MAKIAQAKTAIMEKKNRPVKPGLKRASGRSPERLVYKI
jgi:hypothetical protein